MARGLLVLLLAGALGAGVIYLLDPGGDDDTSITDYGADGGAGDEDLVAALEGSGTELIDEPEILEREKTELQGRVVDADGEPLGGIKVAAYFQNPNWNDHSKEARDYRQPGAALLRRIEKLRAQETPEPDATATSNDDGTFTLHLDGDGSYKVKGLVDAPLYATYTSVTTGSRWAPPPLVIHVLPGKPLRGRLLGEGNAPVVAQITAHSVASPQMYGFANQPKTWEQGPVSSEPQEGRFEFGAIPPGKMTFTARTADGRSFAGLKADWDGTEEVILRVPQGSATLTGRVHTTDDKPVANTDMIVRITASSDGEAGLTVAARSGADGTYTIENLPAGEVASLSATAEGYATINQSSSMTAPWWGLTLEAGKTATLDVLLLKGGTVKGKVTTTAGDEPLAGAQVRLSVVAAQSGLTAQQPFEVVTDAEGHYAFVGVAPGAYRLSVKHKTHYLKPEHGQASVADIVGIANPNMRGNMMSRLSPDTTVVMPTGGGTQVRDLTLTPGIELGGTVLGPGDEPLEGATIHLMGSGQAQQREQTALATTDAEGRFTISNMAPGENWRFYAAKSGFAAEQAETVVITEEESPKAVTLRLILGASITGRVKTDTGDPISGATINCWGSNAELAGGVTWARVDEEGGFTIKDLSPGSWQLWAWAPGQRSQSQTSVKDLKAGEAREGIEIELQGAGDMATITGRVVDQYGKGVSGITLMVRGKKNNAMMHTAAGPDGRFNLTMAGLGDEVTITAMGGGKSQKPQTFNVRDGDIEIVVERPKQRTLRGLVVDLKGNPVPLCSVRLGKGSNASRGNMHVMEATAMAPGMMPGGNANTVNGVFSLRVTGEGPWKITASGAKDRNGRALNLKSTTIDVSDAEPEIRLQMEKGEMLSGIVVGPDQNPVEGATVMANGSSHRTKADGLFAIPGVSGKVTVSVTPPKGFVRPAQIKAEAGDDVRVELEAGLEIGGRVRMPGDAKIGNGRVSLSWPASPGTPSGRSTATLKPDGTFLAQGIPPRVKVALTVSVWQTDVNVTPFQMKDVEPGTLDLEIQMEEGVSITGTVYDDDGSPKKGGYLQASAVEGGNGTGTQISSDGTFELKGLKRGKYKLMTWGSGGQGDLGEVTAPSEGLELRAAPKATIKGTLVGSDLQGFMVRAVSESDATGKTAKYGQVNAKGEFTVQVTDSDENWFLSFTKVGDDRYGLSEGLRAGTTDARVTLQKGESISGRVENSEGEGRKGLFVMINDGVYAYARTDDKGEFEIKGLPSGSYKLRVTGAGANKTLEDVSAGTNDLVITL